ncbi:hypothetical protein BASA50_008238 [Batrachochytrium salamandrivorans]|uniref:Secreted protein n=1 Tax=Batrachochytrium salamandrivorans TaxID=1357716 RepID=A0ABQ8F4K6_9FUNG|nr:hypothetical protein BASA50_008238 [Batrachochytrium salamandrivorans]
MRNALAWHRLVTCTAPLFSPLGLTTPALACSNNGLGQIRRYVKSQPAAATPASMEWKRQSSTPSEDAVLADHTNEPITEMQRHTVEVIKDTQRPIQRSSNATKTGPSSKQTKNK